MKTKSQCIAVWSFTDSDNDVRLFTKAYRCKPTAAQVKKDAFTQYKELGQRGDFKQWLNALCQPGEVKVIPTQQTAVETVLREFVRDVEAVGVAAVREQFDWPDLADTYERAVVAIKE